MIEMLVSLAILVLLATVILSSHTNFTNSIILSNTAYDVALSLHDAESYGIGSRGYGSIVNTGYGLHFSSATPNSYIFFADTNPAAPPDSLPTSHPGDGIYTANSDQVVSTFTVGAGISIDNICGNPSSHIGICSSGGLSSLDIVFRRPNASPVITGITSGGSVNLIKACISLVAPGGTHWYVFISQNGLISTSNTLTCP